MQVHLEAGEVAVSYIPKFREYGIWILDGGTSKQDIHHCPWCGKKLPSSLRDEWFDKLDELGFEEPDDPGVPDAMRSEAWWRNGL